MLPTPKIKYDWVILDEEQEAYIQEAMETEDYFINCWKQYDL